jgi:methylphosphotriester-DNA--protein-cysteine methyltransferase
MIHHITITDDFLRSTIKNKLILFGGNHKLNIYGKLSCISGKKLKRENRVFFCNEKEALANNFRPCGRCMKEAYKKWKIMV